MTESEFQFLTDRLRPYTEYLYFHLMGEPLLHPQLDDFLRIAGEKGFKVILTTNGTLLQKNQETLLASPALHKVNLSLQALEGNTRFPEKSSFNETSDSGKGPDFKANADFGPVMEEYLQGCIHFAKEAEGKKIVVFRLWNEGGADRLNEKILDKLHEAFPGEWKAGRRGLTIGNRIFLEHGEKFDWPDLSAQEYEGRFFCYGLRDQLGVLCDGTVVPCCLDHEGDIALGNLFDQDLASILSSKRAENLLEAFSQGKACEDLCRRCGYARRFTH